MFDILAAILLKCIPIEKKLGRVLTLLLFVVIMVLVAAAFFRGASLAN
jgi:hypothetical protein